MSLPAPTAFASGFGPKAGVGTTNIFNTITSKSNPFTSRTQNTSAPAAAAPKRELVAAPISSSPAIVAKKDKPLDAFSNKGPAEDTSHNVRVHVGSSSSVGLRSQPQQQKEKVEVSKNDHPLAATASRQQRLSSHAAAMRGGRRGTNGAPRWSSEEAQAVHARNKDQLATLSDLVCLTRACTDACDWEAQLALEKQSLDRFGPVVNEITEVLADGERLAADLKKQHAFLTPSSGAVCGEDSALLKAWSAKEGAFIDMFVRHRDRFLKLQREDTLRSLAELTRQAVTSSAQPTAGVVAFADSKVSREYLRPDL